MPIDDALEKIQTNETDKKANVDSDLVNQSSFDLLKEYIEHHKKVYEKENVILTYNFQRMHKFVNSKIRFDKDLSLKVLDFSRQEILEIIGESNKELKELLANTDVINYLPESVQISNTKTFKNIPAFFKIENAIGPNDFAELERSTDNLFLIPNLKIMSLFIGEGEKLRRYAEIIKDNSEQLLLVNNGVHWRPNNFEVNELKLFYDKTKIKDIKKMIDEVEELKAEIESTKRAYKNTWNKDAELSSVKSGLYTRLKTYHQELTVEGGSLQYDKKFIPELPIVVDLDDKDLDDDIPF